MEYFIPENINVIDFFEDKVPIITADLKKELKKISTKNYNNSIGYYQFKSDNNYYQIFITPKIFENIISETEKKINFIKLLTNYYEIFNSGRIDKSCEEEAKLTLEGNIIDYSFEGLELLRGMELQNFVEKKFEDSINVLEKYFKKHKRIETRTISYNSQSINHPINLRKNITSIDKSSVFQLKKEKYNYSKIAIISEKVLRYFKFFRIEHLSEKNKIKCFEKTTKLISKINKAFALNNSFTFSINEILKNDINKLFNKNNELKEVYKSLLILVGLEHFNKNDRNAEIKKIENMISIFFRPEKLYEWIVYDKLALEYNGASIKKDGLPPGTSNIFYLTKDNGDKRDYDSKPDFIIQLTDKIIIADAKWKILDKNPGFDDIAKLKRDWAVYKKIREGSSKQIESLLIYPSIDNIFFSYPNDKFSFEFETEFKFGIKKIEAIN
jgi:hypothetical protein